MNLKIFARVTLAAAAAQVGMMAAGQVSAPVANGLAFGSLVIALLAGAFYARIAKAAWIGALAGGMLTGAACAFLGIGFSLFLHDVPVLALVMGVAGAGVAGLIGGAAGKLTGPRRTVTGSAR